MTPFLRSDRCCPQCGHKGYKFRARRTIDGKPDEGGGKLVELNGHRLGVLPINSALFCENEHDLFLAAGEVLRSGVIKNIALDIHNEILHRTGRSGERLHQHMLSCGYALDDSMGIWVYRYGARSRDASTPSTLPGLA